LTYQSVHAILYLSDSSSERARKRQRLEIIDTSAGIASSSRLGTSAAEHDLLTKDILSMRPPENEYDSNRTSPGLNPQASSSSLPPSPKANGHVANGYGSSINGSSKRSRSPVARVELRGATIYDDSYIDREEYIRLVIQSLRDIGYMYVSSLGFSSVLIEPRLLSESAATLEAESGYVMETSPVAEFRRCILEGTWSEAERALEHLGVAEDDGLWV
jgi:WD repeat-containing protein 26